MNTAHDLVTRFWQTANARDWTGFAAVLAPDVVYEVPQTRECVRSAEHFVTFFSTWPGSWRADIVKLIANETSAVCTIDFVTEQGSETGIGFFELRDGLIAKIIDYWPSPYDPPQRMTDCIERY